MQVSLLPYKFSIKRINPNQSLVTTKDRFGLFSSGGARKMHKRIKITIIAAILAITSVSLLLPREPQIHASAAAPWSTPASVIRINEENITDLIDHRADGNTTIKDNDGEYKAKLETYEPSSRQWQGLASIAVRPRFVLFLAGIRAERANRVSLIISLSLTATTAA